MPKQILPSHEELAWFTQVLIRRGFRPVSMVEFRKVFERLVIIPPTPRIGRELGFTFSANGLEVVVWTTFVPEAGKARDQDAGWILIKEGDQVKYFARPVHRTKHYVHRLAWLACIARLRVLDRPTCPSCGAYMDIAMGEVVKSRYWRCRNRVHKQINLPWDINLPVEAKRYLERIRSARRRYRDTLRREGRDEVVIPAVFKRRGWTVGKSENLKR
jgi:hypothetical protein